MKKFEALDLGDLRQLSKKAPLANGLALKSKTLRFQPFIVPIGFLLNKMVKSANKKKKRALAGLNFLNTISVSHFGNRGNRIHE